MPSPSGAAKVDEVSPEALVLALSTVVRPTSAAAVFAMLAAARPTRLLLAYIICGFAFSAAIGVVVVMLLSGWTRPEAQDEARAVLGIVIGAVSLGYAAGLLSGRVPQPAGDAQDGGLAPDAGVQRWQRRLEPMQMALADGCHLTREPAALVRAAGFELESVESSYVKGPKPWVFFTLGRAVNPG